MSTHSERELAVENEELGGAPAADPNSFRRLVKQHMRSAEEDEIYQEPVREFVTFAGPIPMMQLFNFEDKHWVNPALRSFNEELEMYEIPDILWILMARKRQMSMSTRAQEISRRYVVWTVVSESTAKVKLTVIHQAPTKPFDSQSSIPGRVGHPQYRLDHIT
jgi:hypothetical protein